MHIPAEPAERSRPSMSTGRIMAAALQIVDTEGSQALTMRRLGQALGRKVMTLYRYVPSKDARPAGVVARSSPTSPSTPLPLTGGRNCATSPPPSGASRSLTPTRYRCWSVIMLPPVRHGMTGPVIAAGLRPGDHLALTAEPAAGAPAPPPR